MPRPKWITDWEQAMYEARSNRLGPVVLNDAARRAVNLIYAEMLLEIERIVATSEGALNPVVADTMVRRLRSIITAARINLTGDVEDRINSIIEAIVGAHEDAFSKAFTSAGVQGSITANFSAVPARAIELMALRSQAAGISGNFRSLIATQWGRTFEQVDRFIASQVGLGVSAETSKRRLAFMLASGSNGKIDPALMRALRTRGVAGRRFAQLLRRLEADPDNLGFKTKGEAREQLATARGLLWKSRRIMVSETNTAHSEAHREASIESPVVGYLRWNLSGRHAGLPSSPDVCDTLANRDLHGLGKGVYYPETYPIRPHPNCGCFQSFVLRPITEWGNDKEEPRRAKRVTAAQMKADYGGDISDKAARRLSSRLNAQFKAVENTWDASRS